MLSGDAEEIEGLKKSPEELASLIETAVFKKHQDTGMKYKNQIRSRVFNLKDKKNPGLRVNVLMGLISPEKLANMTAEEMASDDVSCPTQKSSSIYFSLIDEAVADGSRKRRHRCRTTCSRRRHQNRFVKVRKVFEKQLYLQPTSDKVS